MCEKIVCRVAYPAFFILWSLQILSIVACGTIGFIRLYAEILIGAVALEAFYISDSMDGIIPLLVEIRRYVLMALGAGSEFFLIGQGWMGAWLDLSGVLGCAGSTGTGNRQHHQQQADS